MPEKLTEEQREQILELLLQQRKIDAIKVYREATGEGLKESKDFVETIIRELRKEHPDLLPAQKAGCGTTTALLLILVSVVCAVAY